MLISYAVVLMTAVIAAEGIQPLEDRAYWKNVAHADITNILQRTRNENVAKNIILFIADGMGLTTSTAARIYGETEKGYLTFEKFPDIGVLKTYSANKLVPDSCSTATALFSGIKVNHKTAGLDATIAFEDCEASLNKNVQLESILQWAQEAGKATGFVTTTRVTHATPSALYAHTADRNWECEATMPVSARKCKDIAKQLIEDEPGKHIQVIMGGGRQCLQSNVIGEDADPIDTWSCYSMDGRDLISSWKTDKISRGLSNAVISNNEELQNLNPDTSHVLGIFANGHLKMDHDRDRGPKGMPSLTNMTEAAIAILSKQNEGFFLMVEGGMIDFAHHRGHAKQALNEVMEFNRAIEKTLELTTPIGEETLIVVTSDHSHSLVFSGYADRGSTITGIAQESKKDGSNYTSLLYGTGGPDNYQYHIVEGNVVREDPSEFDTNDFQYFQQAAVLTDEVTHGGADVLVYAKGPKSHLFQNVHEQTYVAYVLSYAAKIGPYKGIGHIYLLNTSLMLTLLGLILIIK